MIFLQNFLNTKIPFLGLCVASSFMVGSLILNQVKVWLIIVRRAVKTKAPIRVQFLLTFGGKGGKNKKLWLY